MNPLLLPIFLPLIAAPLIPVFDSKIKNFKEITVTAISLICFITALSLYNVHAVNSIPWAGFGINFTIRIYPFSSFILIAISAFAFLISLYSWIFMKSKPYSCWYYVNYLIVLGFSAGAVLADNLVLMLFFWEGILLIMYAFIALSSNNDGCKATAMKTLIINGTADLCMIVGIAITGYLAGSMDMSFISISKISLTGLGIAAYTLIAIGALAKLGSIPFHTWITDAASNTHVPFMALLPSALDKLLGIYLLTRISTELFAINSSLIIKLILMSIGAVTIIIAVMMALVQTDYKKLLAYNAVSQAGYMILGIGTGTVIGIVGGIFHMINYAVYQSCLFLTAGSIEQKTGITNIHKLGGLFKNMPLTGIGFIIAAAAVSGIPPFNGFFSRELILQGTLQSGYKIFFIAAQVGAFLTLALFLKLGHLVYFGKKPEKLKNVKESSWPMLVPILILAIICIVFGMNAKIPLTLFIEPSFAGMQSHEHLWGFHLNWSTAVSFGVIALAIGSHFYGVKKSGKPQQAVNYICCAPVLKQIYDMAAKRFFDPYEYGMRIVFFLGRGFYVIERIFDFLTDTLPTTLAEFVWAVISKFHSGFFSHYLAWAVLGIIIFSLIVSYGGGIP